MRRIGLFARTHIDLVRLLDKDAESIPAQLRGARGEDEEISLLTCLALSVDELQQAIDAAVYCLPRHIVLGDEHMMADAGIDVGSKVRERERVYAGVFTVLSVLGSRLSRIEQEARRNEQVLANLARAGGGDDSGFLGVAANAVMSFFNPVYGIASGVREFASASTNEKRTKDRITQAIETQTQSASMAVRQWNYIQSSLLPPLIARIVDGVRTERATVLKTLSNQVARTSGADQQRVRAAVARRLARLEVFALYPSPGEASPRGEAIEFLRDRMPGEGGSQFPPF